MVASDEWQWGELGADGRAGLTVSLQLRLAVEAEEGEAAPDVFVLSPGQLGIGANEEGNGVAGCRVTVEVRPPVRERRPVLVPVLAEEITGPVAGSVDLSVRLFWGCTSTIDMRQVAHS